MNAAVRTLVVASGNAGKLREIARLIEPLGWQARAQADFGIAGAVETGATFVENALLKARHASKLSGLPAIADDSGLVVEALHGRPGIRSARYAGDAASDDDNIRLLLDELSGIDEPRRGAAFHCVAVYVRDAADAAPLVAEGRWQGRILEAPTGSGGFGYDPVFADARTGKAAASMSGDEKDALSHRGEAFRELRAQLAGVVSQ